MSEDRIEQDFEDAIPEQETTEDTETSAEDQEAQAEARALGWKPATEWVNRVTGQPEPPPSWFIHDPKEWIRKHREEGPPHLSGKVTALERKVAEKDREIAEITTFFRDYKAKEAERIEARIRQAVEEGDHDAISKALKDRDALRQKEAPPEPAYDPNRDPNYPAWLRENTWYLSDPSLKAYAEAVATEVGLSPAKDGRAFYDAITAEVRRAFPDKFNPGKTMAQPNKPADPAATVRKKSAWGQLPADVKQAFEKSAAVRRGIYSNDEKGREEYARDYLDTYGA